jgi:hypothetical protein
VVVAGVAVAAGVAVVAGREALALAEPQPESRLTPDSSVNRQIRLARWRFIVTLPGSRAMHTPLEETKQYYLFI